MAAKLTMLFLSMMFYFVSVSLELLEVRLDCDLACDIAPVPVTTYWVPPTADRVSCVRAMPESSWLDLTRNFFFYLHSVVFT